MKNKTSDKIIRKEFKNITVTFSTLRNLNDILDSHDLNLIICSFPNEPSRLIFVNKLKSPNIN